MDFNFLKFHLHCYSHYLEIRQSHFFTKMINKISIIKVQLYAHAYAIKQDPLKVIYWYWIAVFICIRQINLHQTIIFCFQKWAKLINYCFESVSEPKRAIYEICYKMWFLFNIFSNCFITFFPVWKQKCQKNVNSQILFLLEIALICSIIVQYVTPSIQHLLIKRLPFLSCWIA